ncbi:hypothetical protein BK143_01250 [Paenibacillus peoriae]|uniref:hypothetical protein n=1 Tax=Paenibacillus TaxID=44249 RepID=UPI00096D150A|nr:MULTISPECIES: hypothetical protein [Paenibacillus]OMF75038.1 hypothetical protein BK143_01250 [Paenibacillus peoriae]WDM23797.1 hypothetical protein J4I02_10070 [Paenibacillus polymyxa]
MKKIIATLALVLCLSHTLTTTLTSVEAAKATSKQKVSSYHEKMDYYNKQIAIIEEKIEKLQSQRIRIKYGTEEYGSSLKKETSLLNQKLYYLDKIMELNS